MGDGVELWPYLLWLPVNRKDRQHFIRSVLASKLAPTVLSSFDKTGTVLQRDLIDDLPHSNKSVLAYLKTLQKYNLIKSGSRVQGGKRIVYHELTKGGWELSQFFFEGLPSDIEQLTESLLEEYLLRLILLQREQQMPESVVFDVFTRTRARAMHTGSKEFENPDCVIVGSIILETKIVCNEESEVKGLTTCNLPQRRTGGDAFSVAVELSASGKRTTFVSRVGNDQNGWTAVSQLIQAGVDINHVVVDDSRTTRELIVVEDHNSRLEFIDYSDRSMVSIDSPSQVPWNILEGTKVVYLSEIYPEVGVSIATYSRSRDIPVVYKYPLIPMDLESGLDEVLGSQIDVLLITRRIWSLLKRSESGNPLQLLRAKTDATIIVRENAKSYTLYFSDGTKKSIRCQGTDDMTSTYIVGLLRGFSEGIEILEAHLSAVAFENESLDV
ncbi:MAG: PfkB family carbohydrate kinase [Candidatus Thorarchaeota archaeon]